MLEYKKDGWKAALSLSPALILMAVFTFYPIFRVLFTAFLEGYTFTAGFNGEDYGWLVYYGVGEEALGYPVEFGIGRFIAVAKDALFQKAIVNTLIIVVISVPLTIIISLFISVALNGIKKGQGLFQTIFFLPYVTNTIALGMVFAFLFGSKFGLINSVIELFGGEPVAWIYMINNEVPTKFSSFIVLLCYTVWTGLAFKILVLLSGMQSIDKQYYQAAQVDGTNRWRTFSRITVPLLSPMIAYVTITSFIGAFKAYTSIIAVFNGAYGPKQGDPNAWITIVGYTYDKLEEMGSHDAIGDASVASIYLFAIIMLITLLQLYVSKKKVHY